jgi:hypothetical protein
LWDELPEVVRNEKIELAKKIRNIEAEDGGELPAEPTGRIQRAATCG